MKIAYCIPGLHNPSGMERVVTLKANYLVSVGYEVHIIITDGAGRDYAYYFIDCIGEQWCNLFESLVNERK